MKEMELKEEKVKQAEEELQDNESDMIISLNSSGNVFKSRMQDLEEFIQSYISENDLEGKSNLYVSSKNEPYLPLEINEVVARKDDNSNYSYEITRNGKTFDIGAAKKLMSALSQSNTIDEVRKNYSALIDYIGIENKDLLGLMTDFDDLLENTNEAEGDLLKAREIAKKFATKPVSDKLFSDLVDEKTGKAWSLVEDSSGLFSMLAFSIAEEFRASGQEWEDFAKDKDFSEYDIVEEAETGDIDFCFSCE